MAIIGGSGVAVRITELRDIVNVVCPSRSDGDILVWNDTLQIWTCTTPTAGLTPHALTDHTNVDTTGQAEGDLLQLSGGVWGPATIASIAADIDLDDLGDVNAPAPNTGECLCWDGAEWVATTPQSIVDAATINLDDLGDVNVGSPGAPEDGYVIQWDNTAGEYNLVAQSGGGATTLDALTDVSVPAPNSGEVLSYVGPNWEATDPNTLVSLALDDLTDVNTGGPGAPEDGYAVVWDNGTGTYILADVTATPGTKQIVTGIVADPGQAQGGSPQTWTSDDVALYVATTATAGDSLTLDSAAAGTFVYVYNGGVNDLAVFPDTGDDLGQGTNASTTIAPGESSTFAGINATTWEEIATAAGGGAGALNDLSDVDVGTPGPTEDGYAIIFNNGTGQWEAAFPTTDSQFIGGITASVTQTQGQEQQTWDANKTEITVVVTTVANDGDVITLDDAAENLVVCVVNDGAFDLQVFPSTGNDLGEGTNTSTTIFAGESATFVGKSATTWEPISEAKLGVVLLNELTDVTSATTPATENYLKFNGATWVDDTPQNLAAQIVLDDISDVAAGSPSTGDLINWDGANWSNITPAAMAAGIAFDDLSDVSEASPVAGDFVYYDGANYTAATRAISDLSDVDTTGVSDTNLLQFNLGAGEWQPIALSSITLDDLGDVVIGTPTTGEVLRYDGANWVDATLGSSDVTNASAVTGATVTAALDQLNTDIGALGTDDIANDSGVTGVTASDALDNLNTAIGALGSDDIANDSTVPGVTVSDALDNVGTLSGTFGECTTEYFEVEVLAVGSNPATGTMGTITMNSRSTYHFEVSAAIFIDDATEGEAAFIQKSHAIADTRGSVVGVWTEDYNEQDGTSGAGFAASVSLSFSGASTVNVDYSFTVPTQPDVDQARAVVCVKYTRVSD